MLRAYLANNGSTVAERLVVGNLVTGEEAKRAKEERLQQTMAQVNEWTRLCKGSSSSNGLERPGR